VETRKHKKEPKQEQQPQQEQPTPQQQPQPEQPEYLTKKEFQNIMTQFAKLVDEKLKTIETAIQQNPTQTNPQNPMAFPIPQLLASLLGGGSGDIIPVEMQKQIIANVMANALNPPDRFSDFLRGFNTALKTLAVLTRRKMPEITVEEEEEAEKTGT
jgi:hypothetical protein